MLRFDGICKSFGSKQVLRLVSYQCQPGAYVLRGPNGAGKSTLLRILAGVTPADSGEVWVDGRTLSREPAAVKLLLAYAPDECPIYPFITGREMLAFVAYAKRCTLTAEVSQIVESFGLRRHLDTRCGEMSLGTQKKLMLAAAWIGTPAVLLFDEPSNGLDINARCILVDMLRAKSDDSVVLISSHDQSFAEAIGASFLELDELQSAPPKAS